MILLEILKIIFICVGVALVFGIIESLLAVNGNSSYDYSNNEYYDDERDSRDYWDYYDEEMQHSYERNFGFYDFAGYWRRFGEKFIDGQGNYVSWDAFQDREGNWYSGSSFRDNRGHWTSLSEGFYDWNDRWVRGR